MSEAHARLGPSNHRWPNCPGSVREEAVYPDISGEAAIDGTGSHLLLELCLKNNVRAESYDRQIIGANHKDNPNGWLVQPDRIARVQNALDYLTARCEILQKTYIGCKIIVEAESKADPGGIFGRDDWWGTCDVSITVVNDHKRCVYLEVIDYKDGRGYVKADDNSQLISYLGGKARPFLTSGPDQCRPFTPERMGNELVMTIVQPKTNPMVRSSTMAPAKLVDELISLNHAARATDAADAPLVPDSKGGTDYCRWCKHAQNCSALAQRDIGKVIEMSQVKDVVAGEDASLFELASTVVGDVATMPADKLTSFMDTRAGVLSAYDKVEKEIERRVLAGEVVPGWEMQPGRGTRVWAKSEEEVAKALKGRRLTKAQIYPTNLISPAAVLKLDDLNADQKERLEKELIVFKAGADKLTRVAITKEKPDTKMMFADVPSFLDPAPAVIEELSFL